VSSRGRPTPLSGSERIRRALVVAGCGVLGVSVSACESTEQESAKLNHEGQQLLAGQDALELGAVNHSVKVSDVTLLSSSGRSAVAVRLTGTSTRPQVDVPLQVGVTSSSGKSLYSNATGGLEASLQRIGLLRAGQPEWWVDDQVLLPPGTSTSSSKVKVQAGTGSAPHPGAALGSLHSTAVHLTQEAGLSTVSGEIVGHFANAHSKVPVFVVAVQGGKVVAAGRAVVSPPSGQGENVPFQAVLVGNPAGAPLQLSVVPTSD
jgi:hypothetical protein